MNEFFNKYVDITALVLAFTIPLLLTISFKQKTKQKLRTVPTYFFLLGPSAIVIFIFFHLFENGYHAIDKLLQGTFEYDFRFYSLFLLGSVIAYLGVLFLNACRNKCLAHGKNRACYRNMLLILLISTPLVPLTPIAFVPSICCGISLAAIRFVRKEVELFSIVVTEHSFAVTAS